MGCFGSPPTDEEKAQKERSRRIEKTIREDKQKYKATHRLLLLGNNFIDSISSFSILSCDDVSYSWIYSIDTAVMSLC